MVVLILGSFPDFIRLHRPDEGNGAIFEFADVRCVSAFGSDDVPLIDGAHESKGAPWLDDDAA